MSRSFSALAIASQNADHTDEVWLMLMRIKHVDITPDGLLRCVNDVADLTGGSDNELYTAFPFQVALPGEEMDQPAVARIRIDNVDRRIIEAVRALPSKALVDFEIVLASQPTTVEIGLNNLTLRAIDFDKMEVTGTVTFEEIFSEPVSLDMTPSRFPGMF
jgi:hypothetical protein